MARGLDIFRKQRAARLGDEQEMAQAQADYADAKARFEAAKAEWQAARSRGDVRAEREARDRLNRARVDAEDASERAKGAHARMAIPPPETPKEPSQKAPRKRQRKPEPGPRARDANRYPRANRRQERHNAIEAAKYQLSLHQRALARGGLLAHQRAEHEAAILELEAQIRELEAGW